MFCNTWNAFVNIIHLFTKLFKPYYIGIKLYMYILYIIYNYTGTRD